MGLKDLSHFFRHNRLSLNKNSLLKESFFNCKISTRLLSELESDYVGHILKSQLDKALSPTWKSGTHSRSLLLEPTGVLDKRLAMVIQAEIESMEVPVRNDISILREKVEQAEKARTDAYLIFENTAKEFNIIKTEIEQLEKEKFSCKCII